MRLDKSRLCPDTLFLASRSATTANRSRTQMQAKSIGALLGHRFALCAVNISADGLRIVAGIEDGEIHTLDMPDPIRGSAERIERWISSITDMKLEPNGGARPLTPIEWREAHRRLEELGGEPDSRSM
jgi:hypothetical protein